MAARMSFSYREDQKAILEKIAKKEHRTVSNLIQIIIDDYLKKKAKKAKPAKAKQTKKIKLRVKR
jgi:hypothetical protein